MATSIPRKPRVGEYYVAHDDPRCVFLVDTLLPDNCIRIQNCVTNKLTDSTIKHFNEFFTRVPIS